MKRSILRWTLAFGMLFTGCEGLYDAQDFTPREAAPIFGLSPSRIQARHPHRPKSAWWLGTSSTAPREFIWFDCWGDKVQMSLDEVNTNMEQVAALIREVDPDVLMLEEIEVNRSAPPTSTWFRCCSTRPT